MREAGARFRKLDAFTTATVRLGVFSVWPTLVAIALGATLFAATHAELLPAMFNNKLTREERFLGLGFFAASWILVGALYLLALRYPRTDHSPPGVDRARRLHPYLSFLLSGPAIVALTEPKIETTHQWLTWLYIALAVLAWWPTFSAWSQHLRALNRSPILSERQRDWIGLGIVFAIWAAYAYVFSKLAITHHHAFQMRTMDLGVYDNIFYQSSHGRPLGCTLVRGGTHASAHFDPILVILSPLYRLWPRAELLLVLQSVWLGAGAVATYLIGRGQLGSRAWGLIWALAYVLHPALHGANLYEFHSLTLVFTPLLFALYFLFSGRFPLYFASLAVLLLIREDVSLLMCFVGLYGVLSGEPPYKRAGWATILISLVYLVVVKTVFMQATGLFNQGGGAHGYVYYYEEMIPNKWGEADFLISLLTNPAFVVDLIAREKKVQYLLVVFFPLLFLPAWAGRARVILLYGLLFILLASKSAVYSPHFQYSAVLLPVAIALAPLGLRRLAASRPKHKSLTAVFMGCVLIASLLVSWKFGAIVENNSFRGGYRTVVRALTEDTRQRYDAFVELISRIEPDASVSVTDRIGAHVSNRAHVYYLDHNVDTDYYLVEAHDLRGRNKSVFDKRKAAGTLELVQRERHWSLYRSVSPAETEEAIDP